MSRIHKFEEKTANNPKGGTFFSIKFGDSRHAQLSIYAAFDEECDFQVKNKEIRRPEAKK